MSFPGRLRSRVTAYRRTGETDADRGVWTEGASRRADIVSKSASDEEIAAGVAGLDHVTISVRIDAETRTWDTSMRLAEVFGPSRQTRVFELKAPPQVDDSGRWLVLQAVAGGVSLDLEEEAP
ncbi:MAG: hypothetical protein C0421_05705 [Hyphomonas sp.]|uniref:phage head completion protein n=1 Tax=Hyphomonas sp. TaxID=87 RepID=UPI0025C64335|nr:head-tail adaptor protein [Hyphomonas sp.]MBA4338322.1 hypothetical protein [Hyphomonas sp.]